ncbi:DUF2155 domain-containing protein [Pseudoruegeria sp. SK021]|uniref:DUF2155 domain-containing protein n=1 Tax=Pseudoruegeria sp. SK021 TaxID=1933035 RepID=UPI000A24AEE3|nr:DUF2155 domain-containing protein [Pseudoruegeria sp. SK021]OSP54960.1 hypothetical protein BV911_09940 [Pseudoruegeria sp. SK021]
MMKPLGLGLAALAAALSVSSVLAEDVAAGRGASLRVLDRMSGELTDLDVAVGGSVTLDRLAISLVECRYPVENPVGDAYAFLLIDEPSSPRPLFEGWMVASSPALNAFDHIRYDVWVLRCNNA